MTYHFKNKKTGKITVVDLKASEYDAYKAKHPNLERYHDSAPAVTFNGRTFGGLDSKTDNTFKEVLAKIGEAHPTSPLGKNYRKNKSVKEIKTRDIIKKHADRHGKLIQNQ
jgi:hypothetical protein